MPTYDYQCRQCRHTIEVIHSMQESGPERCERCGGELRRVFFPTGIIFKGSGFYKTDSRSTGSPGSTASTSTPSSATSSTASGTTPSTTESSGDGSAGATSPPAKDAGTKESA